MNLKKKRILIICSFMLITMLLSTVIGVTSFKPEYGSITATNLNFRQSVNGGIISTIPINTNVKLIGSIDNYYIVQLNNNQIGLLSQSYIDILSITITIGDTFYRYVPYTAYVINDGVNLRQGPSTTFDIITTLNSNEEVTIIGIINDFYIVVTSSSTVGAIQKDLLTTNIVDNNNDNNFNNDESNENIIISNNEIYDVLELINNARVSNGISKLELNSDLNKIANLKSIELSEENYFLHKSPTYGTPFEMMQNFGITYLSAGENIARNINISTAVNNWIESTTNSKNIFNTLYTDIGIGISTSETYGYIIVAMFIQK